MGLRFFSVENWWYILAFHQIIQKIVKFKK